MTWEAHIFITCCTYSYSFIYILQLFESQSLSELCTGGFVTNARPILYPQIHEIHRDARSSSSISILILKETNLLVWPILTDTSRSVCCDLSVHLDSSSLALWTLSEGKPAAAGGRQTGGLIQLQRDRVTSQLQRLDDGKTELLQRGRHTFTISTGPFQCAVSVWLDLKLSTISLTASN